ncbi:MAG: metal-dependent hydrolase [Candidatus Bipolaricaulota bacterium]|nr:metal-dependent hydrolase [Candidatus Bipolaricaulota bacterium]MDW8031184.1 metal-dependent hydrolase [Candidatus Bipolaricaulota bacterium]
MQITFIGHAAVEIRTNKHSILIDPFITGNPVAKHKPEDFKPDAILLTHGHADHLGDAVSISQRTGAPIIAIFELATYCQSQGAKAVGMNIGGPSRFEFGTVQLTPAIHSSSHNGHYLGEPCGIVLTTLENTKIYHAGDTALFGDMALIGKLGLDIAFLPIGSYYTMDPDAAAEAVQLLKPKIVIPIHYNTLPAITQDPHRFKTMVESRTQTQVIIMRPGESVTV